jgi:hypothetical protein
MAKLAINDNSGTDDDQVVSPTQNQMDQWVEQELAEAEEDKMLKDETPTTIFQSDESID